MSTLAIDTIQGATTATSVDMSGVTGLQMPAGHVLQTIAGNSDTVFNSTSTSWTDTGLFSLTFPRNLQSGSKVLARVMATIGETANNNWSNRMNLSIFENTTNKGSDSYGVVNGNAHHQGNTSWTQYEARRISGEVLFTPSVLNGTYKLYFKGNTGSITFYVGRSSGAQSQNPIGQTQLILQEIAQ